MCYLQFHPVCKLKLDIWEWVEQYQYLNSLGNIHTCKISLTLSGNSIFTNDYEYKHMKQQNRKMVKNHAKIKNKNKIT